MHNPLSYLVEMDQIGKDCDTKTKQEPVVILEALKIEGKRSEHIWG